jgi:putative acetyltransferase
MRIEAAPAEAHLDGLVVIWEKAVRATHLFLSEERILYYKDLVRHSYLQAVELVLAYDEAGSVTGFMGLLPPAGACAESGGAGDRAKTRPAKVAMLFVDPGRHGEGTGRALLRFAEERYGALDVDVNEQNPGACRFYEKCGFSRVGRSERDGEGLPYPLLHLHRPST